MKVGSRASPCGMGVRKWVIPGMVTEVLNGRPGIAENCELKAPLTIFLSEAKEEVSLSLVLMLTASLGCKLSPLMSTSACVIGDKSAVKDDVFDGDAVEKWRRRQKRKQHGERKVDAIVKTFERL